MHDIVEYQICSPFIGDPDKTPLSNAWLRFSFDVRDMIPTPVMLTSCFDSIRHHMAFASPLVSPQARPLLFLTSSSMSTETIQTFFIALGRDASGGELPGAS
jgi:hypothetical protein